jgi:hypothetical protein
MPSALVSISTTSACAKDVSPQAWRRPGRYHYGTCNNPVELRRQGHTEKLSINELYPNKDPSGDRWVFWPWAKPGDKISFCSNSEQNPPPTSQRLTRSIRCLKLDGFVVDYLPFEQELSRIALLTCGKDCIDSGLRAPKTPRTPHSKQCPYTIYIGDRN